MNLAEIVVKEVVFWEEGLTGVECFFNGRSNASICDVDITLNPTCMTAIITMLIGVLNRLVKL